MGASGAGKSTLLNVLSGRNTTNGGEVLYNGEAIGKSKSVRGAADACFIQQEDMFYGSITVLEHLKFQSRLRIAMPKADCYARTEDIIAMFGLSKVRDSRIGNLAQNTKRGISGGEKKRLSVATELLTNPPLVFADEPTSGLDSFMAEAVVDILAQLAKSGHTVIATIHQPSSDIFESFNKILLLSEGRVVYYGPREAAVSYFTHLGHLCPPLTNPADYLIELLAIDWENPTEQLDQLERFVEHWRQSGDEWTKHWESRRKATNPQPSEDSTVSDGDADFELKKVNNFSLPLDENGLRKTVPWWTAEITVLMRIFLNTQRSPLLTQARLAQALFISLVAGFIFLRLDDENWRSKSGAAFFVIFQMAFQSVTDASLGLSGDKPLFQREKESGLYSTWTLMLARFISDIPMQVVLPVIFTSILWWMLGFRDSFWYFLLAVSFGIMTTLSSTGIGYIAASLAPSGSLAVAISPVILVPMLMTNPFFINPDSLHWAWYWLSYSSPFTYAWKGFMYAVFHNVGDNCMDLYLQFSCGTEILEYYHIDEDRLGVYYAALVAIGLVGRLLAGFLLVLTTRKKQNE